MHYTPFSIRRNPFKVRTLALASSSNSQTLPANGASRTRPTRHNASLSCTACKIRTTKCQGRPPCENCVKYQTECQREEDKDGRRQTSLKRKLAKLEQNRDLLVRLLETIRDDEDVKVAQLLNLIRGNAPPDIADGRQRSRRGICPDSG